ncbi:MAG TPA: nucleotide exchange factor GrpE [Candidatus Moranbacteria bacterium]|nr:nucleotide exchange factor GrpE [Candidatus Moranbacteria bacterium]
MEKEKKVDSDPRPMALTIKAVVLNENNEVLILKRAKSDFLNAGKYDLPGGHIGENESFEDSIIREIKEEAGLETVLGEIIDVVEFPKDSPLFKEEKRGIRCICYSKSTEVKLSPEHEEYEWLSFEKALLKLSEKDGFENEKRNTILKAQKIIELKNSLAGWKRCMADFENYKKRQAENLKDTVAYSNANLISEILPVLDNFHASTDHIPEDQKESGWVVGIMHIQKQLEKVLEDNGVNEISVKVGDKFDPSVMEAIKHEEGSKNKEESEKELIIKKIVMKGYEIGEKVIRVARVIVE